MTGCSTGFGRELAKLIVASGEPALLTARNPDSLADLAQGDGPAKTVVLDVTNPAHIATVVEELQRLGDDPIVLVNNAGYGYMTSVEEGEEDQIRAMFETNFFGLAALTRAVLPLMRRQKAGHVVNISSVGGLVGNPSSGYYAATKFAVEGLSESLARETAPLGIRVTLVEPGPFRTDWAGRSLKQTETQIEDYKQTTGARLSQLNALTGTQAGDPVRAAQAILDIVQHPNPPLHLVLGRPGLEMVQTKLRALQDDLRQWEQVTLGADYPADQQAA